MPEYWYNVNTHEAEEDAMSDWSQLIGPYKTREEAEHALEKVKARNESGKATRTTSSIARPKPGGRLHVVRRQPHKLRRPGRGPGAQLRHPGGPGFPHPVRMSESRLRRAILGKCRRAIRAPAASESPRALRLAAARAASTATLIITGALLPGSLPAVGGTTPPRRRQPASSVWSSAPCWWRSRRGSAGWRCFLPLWSVRP